MFQSTPSLFLYINTAHKSSNEKTSLPSTTARATPTYFRKRGRKQNMQLHPFLFMLTALTNYRRVYSLPLHQHLSCGNRIWLNRTSRPRRSFMAWRNCNMQVVSILATTVVAGVGLKSLLGMSIGWLVVIVVNGARRIGVASRMMLVHSIVAVEHARGGGWTNINPAFLYRAGK